MSVWELQLTLGKLFSASIALPHSCDSPAPPQRIVAGPQTLPQENPSTGPERQQVQLKDWSSLGPQSSTNSFSRMRTVGPDRGQEGGSCSCCAWQLWGEGALVWHIPCMCMIRLLCSLQTCTHALSPDLGSFSWAKEKMFRRWRVKRVLTDETFLLLNRSSKWTSTQKCSALAIKWPMRDCLKFRQEMSVCAKREEEA